MSEAIPSDTRGLGQVGAYLFVAGVVITYHGTGMQPFLEGILGDGCAVWGWVIGVGLIAGGLICWLVMPMPTPPPSDTLNGGGNKDIIWPTAEQRQTLLAQVGRRAVYRGTGVLVPVLTKNVEFEHQGRPFVQVQLEAVDGVCFLSSDDQPPFPTQFRVGAQWPFLSVCPGEWSFSEVCCCWKLILNEEGCDAVLTVWRNRSLFDRRDLLECADLVAHNPSALSGVLAHKSAPDGLEWRPRHPPDPEDSH